MKSRTTILVCEQGAHACHQGGAHAVGDPRKHPVANDVIKLANQLGLHVHNVHGQQAAVGDVEVAQAALAVLNLFGRQIDANAL
jgi:hypothetical protein